MALHLGQPSLSEQVGRECFIYFSHVYLRFLVCVVCAWFERGPAMPATFLKPNRWRTNPRIEPQSGNVARQATKGNAPAMEGRIQIAIIV